MDAGFEQSDSKPPYAYHAPLPLKTALSEPHSEPPLWFRSFAVGVAPCGIARVQISGLGIGRALHDAAFA